MTDIYYQNKSGALYCGDSLEILENIPDNYYDLVLTDPPYGIGVSAKKNLAKTGTAKSKKYINFIDEKISRELLEEIIRVSKNQIIWGGNYYCNWLQPTSCMLVWDKLNGKCDYADGEIAWTSFNSALKIFAYLWAGYRRQNQKKEEYKIHLTQKPEALFHWCLTKYAKDGDKILDPFFGGGTTGAVITKMNNNMKWTGIEVLEGYCKLASERIDRVEINDMFLSDKQKNFLENLTVVKL